MSRDDVNIPDFYGALIYKQVLKVKFKVEVYKLLRSELNILASWLLYSCIPRQYVSLKLDLP